MTRAAAAEQIRKEVDCIPDERLPDLVELVREFREQASLLPPVERFRKGWEEAMRGDTLPLTPHDALPSPEEDLRSALQDVAEGRILPIEALWDAIGRPSERGSPDRGKGP